MGSKRKRQAQEAPIAAPAAKKHQKAASKPADEPAQLPVVSTPFLDNAKGPDLKREVQLYDKLSSEDGAERLQAADAVVSGLLADAGVSESTLQRHLERRLFRGLASGRKGARLGFSVVITELLGQLFAGKELSKERYPGLSFDKVVGILTAKTKPDGDLSGQEERDHALGLLFGLQCFVRAKILFGAGLDRWQTIFDALVHLAKKKPWMREECGWVIVEALAQMDQKQAENTLENLLEAGLAASPEGVGVWLTARQLFPDMKFPSKPWGQSGNPLEHLKSLAKALKESSSAGDDKGQQAKQTGNWNPQLHFVWNLVLDQYIKGAKAGDEDVTNEFENFWKVAVDENLFSASASRERKFWGFLLFQKMVQDAAPYEKLLSSIFSPNLVRCLINHLSQEDRFLHRAADKSLKVLQQVVEGSPDITVTILPKLISGNGFYNFDQVTKTKTIDKMLSQVDGDAAGVVVHDLLAPIVEVDISDDARDAENRRQVFGDYLLSMIRRVNINDETRDISWVEADALPTLASLAYCETPVCKPALSEKSRTMFRTRLTSAFAHLISDPKGFSYPCKLLQSFSPDAVEMDDEIADAKDKALAIMEKLIKKAKKAAEQEKKSLQALALLYALVNFQLYNGEADAVSVLDELKVCYDKLIRGKGKDDSEDDASQILVEILLSFMSKASVLLRKVAQHVFTAFAGDITEEGLKLMTDVLESSESLRGQQELFDQDDGEDQEVEDEASDEDDEELGSDVEIVDVNGEAESGDEDEDEDEDEEGSEEEEEEEDNEEAAKLDAALAKALGTHRGDEDLKAESSDSDADMSDSEMLELDSKLVEIFSQRKKLPNKKREKKDARENIVNFKTRILDLLEIYVKKQPSNPLAFGLLIPLLQLMRSTSTKQLAEKAHNIISAFAKATKSAKADLDSAAEADSISQSFLLEMLKAIHAEAPKDAAHAFARAASTASLLVAGSMFRGDKGSVLLVADVYRDSQVSWIVGNGKGKGKGGMQAVFFHDWVNWCQSHAGAVDKDE